MPMKPQLQTRDHDFLPGRCSVKSAAKADCGPAASGMDACGCGQFIRIDGRRHDGFGMD